LTDPGMLALLLPKEAVGATSSSHRLDAEIRVS